MVAGAGSPDVSAALHCAVFACTTGSTRCDANPAERNNARSSTMKEPVCSFKISSNPLIIIMVWSFTGRKVVLPCACALH